MNELAKWLGLALMLAGSMLLVGGAVASTVAASSMLGDFLAFVGIAALAGSLPLFYAYDRWAHVRRELAEALRIERRIPRRATVWERALR
ncbi:hypothetical protein [Lacipirellula sp.]|uniref:hypothetical protein n=1 Tax=Lacipirellula sp. TaxID=2691419 RepID=UPI003D0F1318